jgi:transmembrane sensor
VTPSFGRNPDRISWDLLDRYLAGECSEAEEARVREALSRHPDLAAQLEGFSDALPLDATAPDSVRSLAAARERLSNGGSSVSPAPHRRPRIEAAVERSHWWKWPVIGLAAASIGAVIFVNRREPKPTPPPATAPATRTVSTARGERTTVRFADGTQIMLAPESRLHIPVDESSGAREVALEGAAYFTVTHDEKRPFIVRTAHSVTRDVGTTFVVRAYPELRDTRVAVIEGKVALRSSRDTVSKAETMLDRGDLAHLAPDGKATVKHNANLSVETAWTNGMLMFDRAPLPEVLAEIGRTFNVDVRLADRSLRDRRVTVTFHEEDLTTVLEVLGTLLNAKITKEGGVVSVSGSNRP